jgi:integrase/recombinase XerD
VSRVNIVKRIKSDGRWKMLSIPRNSKGNYDWNALPDGRYYVEWYMGGTRRRSSAGVTTAQALEAQRRKRHELEGRKLGVSGFETAGEAAKKQPLHAAITKYLEQIDALKKHNTHRKYEAVLNRFGQFFRDTTSIDAISGDDLTRFVVALKRDHKLGANTVLHNAVIVAQFLKRHGRNGITRELQLPERVTSLPKEYRENDLGQFFEACYDSERVLFSTFLLTGFREQEVMYLFWSDINLQLQTVRVTAKPELGFYPKRCEEREIPAPAELIAELQKHTRRPKCQFVFPSPTGNREQHMLDRCKAVAKRAGLDPEKFDLKTFRSTYATRMLRQGFDVRTVQHWMGHKSLETTMRYLVPASDVHGKLDQVKIPAPALKSSTRRSPASETASPRRGRPARKPVATDGSSAATASESISS